ncbi:MAG: hypothetical protein ACAI35_23125 [Candidatus Methylacidiphilales bacterium]|nr:hypothetical protein [Candidatus Methylacidiphilales bacterium]
MNDTHLHDEAPSPSRKKARYSGATCTLTVLAAAFIIYVLSIGPAIAFIITHPSMPENQTDVIFDFYAPLFFVIQRNEFLARIHMEYCSWCEANLFPQNLPSYTPAPLTTPPAPAGKEE